jgi:hypothetical protein
MNNDLGMLLKFRKVLGCADIPFVDAKAPQAYYNLKRFDKLSISLPAD